MYVRKSAGTHTFHTHIITLIYVAAEGCTHAEPTNRFFANTDTITRMCHAHVYVTMRMCIGIYLCLYRFFTRWYKHMCIHTHKLYVYTYMYTCSQKTNVGMLSSQLDQLFAHADGSTRICHMHTHIHTYMYTCSHKNNVGMASSQLDQLFAHAGTSTRICHVHAHIHTLHVHMLAEKQPWHAGLTTGPAVCARRCIRRSHRQSVCR